MQADELSSKYVRISDEHAKEGWTELYDAAATSCMHGSNCALGPDCQASLQCTVNYDCLSLAVHSATGQIMTVLRGRVQSRRAIQGRHDDCMW